MLEFEGIGKAFKEDKIRFDGIIDYNEKMVRSIKKQTFEIRYMCDDIIEIYPCVSQNEGVEFGKIRLPKEPILKKGTYKLCNLLSTYFLHVARDNKLKCNNLRTAI